MRKRTTIEDQEMLNAAHTAAYHWQTVGPALHQARPTMLLAEVHALLVHGETAWNYAEKMKNFFLAKSSTPDWKVAFTHLIHAHAACAAGRSETHNESYQSAEAFLAAVQATFKDVPTPAK